MLGMARSWSTAVTVSTEWPCKQMTKVSWHSRSMQSHSRCGKQNHWFCVYGGFQTTHDESFFSIRILVSPMFTDKNRQRTRATASWINLHWINLCEQVLFVYVLTAIPPRLSDSCNFMTVLLVTREPEQTTLLFWKAASGDSRRCAPFSNLFSPLIFWPPVCLPSLCLPSPFYAPSHV